MGPDFLIIGAARSGTTSLARELSRHPQIRISDPKEPHFLALHDQEVDFRGPGDRETINKLAITDESQWRTLFRPSGDWRWGEGSASTLYYSERAVEAIERFCPEVRMIAILRTPAERAYSAHQYLISRGFETETFRSGLDLEAHRRHCNFHHLWHYRRMGSYGDQLAPFIERFGTQKLLVLDHSTYATNPKDTLRRCFEFIDVDPRLPRPSELRVNEGGRRPAVLVDLERRLRASPRVTAVVKTVVPPRMRELARRVGRVREQMPDDIREELQEHYRTDAHRLVDLLGPEAPSWARAS